MKRAEVLNQRLFTGFIIFFKAIVLLAVSACWTQESSLVDLLASVGYEVLDGYAVTTPSSVWLWNNEGLSYFDGNHHGGGMSRLHSIPFPQCADDASKPPLVIQEKNDHYWIESPCDPLGMGPLTEYLYQEVPTFSWDGELSRNLYPLNARQEHANELGFSDWLILSDSFCSWNSGNLSIQCHDDEFGMIGHRYSSEEKPRIVGGAESVLWLQDYYGKVYVWRYGFGERPVQLMHAEDPVSIFPPIIHAASSESGAWLTSLTTEFHDQRAEFSSELFYLSEGSGSIQNKDEVESHIQSEILGEYEEMKTSLRAINSSGNFKFLKNDTEYVWFCADSKLAGFEKAPPYSVNYYEEVSCPRGAADIHASEEMTWVRTSQGVYSITPVSGDSGSNEVFQEYPLEGDADTELPSVDWYFSESDVWLILQEEIFHRVSQGSFKPIGIHASRGGEQRIYNLGGPYLIQTSQMTKHEWPGLYKIYLYDPDSGVQRLRFPETEELVGRRGRDLLIEDVQLLNGIVWILFRGESALVRIPFADLYNMKY